MRVFLGILCGVGLGESLPGGGGRRVLLMREDSARRPVFLRRGPLVMIEREQMFSVAKSDTNQPKDQAGCSGSAEKRIRLSWSQGHIGSDFQSVT